MSETMYRQGDVLIRRVDREIPENAERVKPDKLNRHILAEGEVTGHAHAVPADAGEMFLVNERLLLQIDQETEVKHEEHGFIHLTPGTYEITRQREYTPESIRYVAD